VRDWMGRVFKGKNNHLFFPTHPLSFMMKKEFWIILGCTVVLVVTMGYALFWMTTHLEELRSNPFVYSAQLYSEEAGSDLYCSCRYDSPRLAPFNFDKNNITFPEPEARYDPRYDINVTQVLGSLIIDQ
jgi:hypothetical protein